MTFKNWWAQHAYAALGAIAVFLLLAICFIGIANAAGTSATLRWTLANQYTNGTALPVANIKETLIEWRIKGQATVAGSARVASPAVTTIVDLGNASCGAYDFVAKTVLTDTAISDPSGIVAYDTGVKCKPNPPTAVTVT